MTDPYYLLGVDREADDAGVRKAYLERIRQWPPEHYPERFQEISQAYTLIQTRKKRLEFQLFHRELADLAPLKGAMLAMGTQGRPTLKELTGWLQGTLVSFRMKGR